MPAKKKNVPARRGRKATTRTTKRTSAKRGARKDVSPTRGRLQLFDISEISAPFTDTKGRDLVTCKYADGTKRVYSVETIVKNKEPLVRILGAAKVRRAMGK